MARGRFESFRTSPARGAHTIRSFRDLEVWQKAIALTVSCYELTSRLPTRERFGLTSQIQRAAVSIAANIAEGHGRRGLGEYLHYLGIARASLMELETHLFIVHRLGYVSSRSADHTLAAAAEVGRMLSGLIRSLEALRAARGTDESTPDTRHPAPASCPSSQSPTPPP